MNNVQSKDFPLEVQNEVVISSCYGDHDYYCLAPAKPQNHRILKSSIPTIYRPTALSVPIPRPPGLNVRPSMQQPIRLIRYEANPLRTINGIAIEPFTTKPRHLSSTANKIVLPLRAFKTKQTSPHLQRSEVTSNGTSPLLKKPTILTPRKTPTQFLPEIENPGPTSSLKRISSEDLNNAISQVFPSPKRSRKQLFVSIEMAESKQKVEREHCLELESNEWKNKVDMSDLSEFVAKKKKSSSPKKPKKEVFDEETSEKKKARETKREEKQQRITFSQRSEKEENQVVYAFEKDGMDWEDYNYLEEAFDALQNEEPILWGRKLTWIPQKIYETQAFKSPVKRNEGIPNYFDDNDLEGIIPNSSGCARTQGYYKLSKFQKHVQRLVDRKIYGSLGIQDLRCVRHNIQVGNRAISGRRIQAASSSTFSGTIDDYQKGKLAFHKKKIKFSKSSIHGWGLFAMESISPDELIIEYIGELIRPTVSDIREQENEKKGFGASYFFRIDEDLVIDATNHGNFSRFINHSCRPNCYARVITIDDEKHIYIYSKTYIEPGEELTYDYKFPFEDQKIECYCGVKGCRRYLN